ncbi:rubredoxin [Segniliparus rugosus]|uniref:rubredoxin n=1 Tax=Segniliparus rugosus TaxID=286804 RepID=UPI0002EF1BFC|nr:rubredoxin [Segniliparus rugosus]
MSESTEYTLYFCPRGGSEYDEAPDWPEDGVAPGARRNGIPEGWTCPDRGAAKPDFEMVEKARS